MPRVSAQHEQEVRERIVRAATRVFSERGFHRATMQDIVRASGLSVGAIYTYFRSKDELILAGCDLITDQEMTELARRVAPVEGFRERIARSPSASCSIRSSWRARTSAAPACCSCLGGGRHLAGDPRDAPPPPARGPRRRGGAHPGGHRARRVPGVDRDRSDRGRARGTHRRRHPPEHRGRRRLPPLGGRAPGPRPDRGPRWPRPATPATRRLRPPRPARLRAWRSAPPRDDRPRTRPDRPRPIDPAELGWVLPHEHTAIALWHIPNRWDYWELRRDEPVIVEELAAFRAAGGGTVVDLTLDGVGPGSVVARRAVARATGLHVVMGSGWYRGAHYPAEALIDRRSVDALADEIVRDATDGRRPGPGSGPGSSARSGPTSRGSAPRRSGSTGPPPGPPAGPGSRSRPTRSSRRSGSTSSTSSRPRAPTCPGS